MNWPGDDKLGCFLGFWLALGLWFIFFVAFLTITDRI